MEKILPTEEFIAGSDKIYMNKTPYGKLKDIRKGRQKDFLEESGDYPDEDTLKMYEAAIKGFELAENGTNYKAAIRGFIPWLEEDNNYGGYNPEISPEEAHREIMKMGKIQFPDVEKMSIGELMKSITNTFTKEYDGIGHTDSQNLLVHKGSFSDFINDFKHLSHGEKVKKVDFLIRFYGRSIKNDFVKQGRHIDDIRVFYELKVIEQKIKAQDTLNNIKNLKDKL